MTTFLNGAKDLARELRVSPGPSDTTNQTGELERLVFFYRDAYTELQSAHGGNWRWLRKKFTFDTTASDDEYAYTDVTDVEDSATISRFNRWYLNDRYNPPKIYKTASGVGNQRWLQWLDWDSFSLIYKIGSQSTTDGSPVHITVDPADNIVLGPIPDDTYTVTGEYYRSPQILANDDDEPEMPSHFHGIIKYLAMAKYAADEAAPEIFGRAYEMNTMMTNLKMTQLQPVRLRGPMV